MQSMESTAVMLQLGAERTSTANDESSAKEPQPLCQNLSLPSPGGEANASPTPTATPTATPTSTNPTPTVNKKDCQLPPSPGPPLAKAHRDQPHGPPTNYCNRRCWVTTDRMNDLRRRAQEAVKQNKTFTIRGCFSSVRSALIARGWVEKLDVHRKHVPNGICQVTFEDLAQGLPKRKPGETRRQYILKCERNIMSRFLEHMPIDFLWTNRKEKCDFIDQAKNPGMTINKFHRAPFTSKEGLCSQLKDFHWFYEEGTAEMYFPRCFNVWSPEELAEFVENFKLTSCIGYVRWMVEKYGEGGFDSVFSPAGKIPFTSIDFAYKRCTEFIESCEHNDIDAEDPPRIWDHDWDAFLHHQHQITNENGRIQADPHRLVENLMKAGAQLLENIQHVWPQYSLDGYQNLWIVKPANKCRGRGIQLMDNLKRILAVVNPSIASKSRYVVQKYIERPLIIHNTKFDIRQWFLITNVQPLVVWMYKESYLRFSSQEYSLANHHESVHLTNHAIQKKYTNGKRDKRLPIENMWDCYSFQAYLRQIGKQQMWLERIYPGMRKAIVGTMLASQENMDRRPNTFELFGADFMISEDFYPWLIEINSSPDLGATTSVTARMCPQCLEDVIKVVIDRRTDPKADAGNFELIYRQVVPPTPAYMGLNLFVKGKQLVSKANSHHGGGYHYHHHRRERSLNTSHIFRQRTSLIPAISNVHRAMPTFNATEYIEKCLGETQTSSRSSVSGTGTGSLVHHLTSSPLRSRQVPKTIALTAPPSPSPSPCPNLLKTPLTQIGIIRRSLTTLSKPSTAENLNPMPLTTSKRHRSCGSRLSSVGHKESERSFKFIIRKCPIQSGSPKDQPSPEVRSEPATSSNETKPNHFSLGQLKSGDVIPHVGRHSSRICERLRKSSITTDQSANHHQSSLRSQSCVADRNHSEGNGRRRVGNRRGEKMCIDVEQTHKANKVPAEATLSSSSSSIHAIGQGLSTWKLGKRHASSRKAAIGGGKAASAYGCKAITNNTNNNNNSTTTTANGDQCTRARNSTVPHRSSKFSEPTTTTIARNTRC